MGLKLPKATFFRNASDALVGHGKLAQRQEHLLELIAS